MAKPKAPVTRFLPRGVRILHEDRDLIVIDKPPGLLTIATDRESDKTAYAAMMDYVRKGQPKSRARVFIVHRLDRDTSGVLLLARSEETKRQLQANWEDTEKVYQAVVHGAVREDEGLLSDHLVESSGHRVHISVNPNVGLLSRTRFRVVERTSTATLLEIALLTGRKHQIRVQLAAFGHPVVGDRVYGIRDRDTFRRLGLHAQTLTFSHPRDGARVTLATDLPGPFRAWMSHAARRDKEKGATPS